MGDPLDVAAQLAPHEAGTMSPLQRVILHNLAYRIGVQIPVFFTYRILAGRPR